MFYLRDPGRSPEAPARAGGSPSGVLLLAFSLAAFKFPSKGISWSCTCSQDTFPCAGGLLLQLSASTLLSRP